MEKKGMLKKTTTIMIAGMLVLSLMGAALPKYKVLNFDNPGTKRALKSNAGSFYFYRSLPEKSMTVSVKGLSGIELRSFSTDKIAKPQVIVTMNKKKTTYDLIFSEVINGYYVYKPVAIPVPAGAETADILCYNKAVYFRSFYTVVPKPKVSTKKPSLQITEHAGMIKISHDGKQSDYYSFTQNQELRFVINNNRNADLYVRARLMDKTLPAFELYHNGKLIDTYDFSLKRTTQYKVPGVSSLSIGRKIVLKLGNGEYVLKAKTDHMFFARPVIVKS